MTLAPDQVHLAIGSRFENIELVQVVLEDTLRELLPDPDARHWVGIAVREAVANAIKHGNQRDPDKPVAVDIAIDEGQLIVRVEDQGEGFDPAQVADPLAPENRLRPSGRGIFYMKSFMDEIEYSFRPGGGTVVTMRKRLPRLDNASGSDTREEQP